MKRQPRLGVVCDLVEENWPSMQLVATQLLHELHAGHRQEVEAVRIQPAMRRRFSKLHGAVAPRLSRNPNGRRWFNADRFANRYWDYPRLLRRSRNDFDLFHVVDHSYSQLVHRLPPERTVVTCHDLHTFRCLLSPGPERRTAAFRAMTRYTLRGLERAARVVFDAGAVRDEAVARGLVRHERTAVVPLGVDPVFSTTPDPEADAEVERLLGAQGAGRVDLLHVGGTYGRKRIDLLLEIFAAARRADPRLRLVRVGGVLEAEQQAHASRLGISESIVTLPPLESRALASVYRRAALLLLPSEEEGFGFPVLEALRCGTPVLASELPVLREVGGETVDFVGVGEVERWAEGVARALAAPQRDPEGWRRTRAAGAEHAARFTWAGYAAEMVSIYRQVLAS
jgi:glycosyltransferase involved in cell wall biosynthesis